MKFVGPVNSARVHCSRENNQKLQLEKKNAQIGKRRRVTWIQTPPKCARYSHHLILKYSDQNSIFTCITQNFKTSFRRRECKWMKRIILEYYFLPLFGSINGGNGKSIQLFGSLSRSDETGKREHSFLSIPLKSQIFIPLEIGRNGRELN